MLTGHVDGGAGPAVFARLRRASRSATRCSSTGPTGRRLRFAVTRVARYPKDAFPTAEVYGPTPDAELRLITCGGAFDRVGGQLRRQRRRLRAGAA